MNVNEPWSTPPDGGQSTLSPPGADRRDAMLQLLLVAQRDHVTRRRRSRRLMALGGLALAGVAVAVVVFRAGSETGGTAPGTSPRAPVAVVADGSSEPDAVVQDVRRDEIDEFAANGTGAGSGAGLQASRPLIVRVEHDATVVDRLKVSGQGKVTRLDDRALLRRLAELGRPTGLVSIDGRMELTDPVVDDAGDVGRARPGKVEYWVSGSRRGEGAELRAHVG